MWIWISDFSDFRVWIRVFVMDFSDFRVYQHPKIQKVQNKTSDLIGIFFEKKIHTRIIFIISISKSIIYFKFIFLFRNSLKNHI